MFKSIEVLRNGISDEIHVLNECEMEQIFGGLLCTQGYFLSSEKEICGCGFIADEEKPYPGGPAHT